MREFVFNGIPTDISVDVITPQMQWEARHKSFENRKRSNRLYDSLTEEERRVVMMRLKNAIQVMHDKIEDWLPDAFVMEDMGSYIKIEFNLLVADIVSDVAKVRQLTNYKLKEISDEFKEELQDLDEA